MSTAPQRRPWSNWVALGVVGAAVVAATVVTTSGTLNPAASAQPAASSVAPAHPTPQPTRTATIKGKVAVTIKPELSATVTGMTAVSGDANTPGEIAGPAVRFAITIKNTTGKTFDLSHTVVNAYYGATATPAQQLSTGGTALPTSLADGDTATGAFVFTIPQSARGTVVVTVDTSVANPVVAFKGAAPQ